MSDDLTNVPRRLRRFYRHGEPVPDQLKPENNPPHESDTHEEDEPWMKSQPPRNVSPQNNSASSRRNDRRARATNNPSPSTPATNAPPSGLFGRVLSNVNKPTLTPMDHALGLHGKAQFEEKLPNASEKALAQKPIASSTANSPLPRTAQAQQEIQTALNELRNLAQKDDSPKNESKKTNVSLTSFHFTPAGEAPRAPDASENNSSSTQTQSSSATSSPLDSSNLSPRERAEQRRMNRGNTPATSSAASATAPATSSAAAANTSAPGHIRRRMGQVETSSTLPESARDEMSGGRVSPSEKDDEDFKSLFGESKKKDKKKKKGDEDDDFSLDSDAEDDGGELELFEDEK